MANNGMMECARRSFVKWAAVAASALGGVAVMGEPLSAQAEEGETEPDSEMIEPVEVLEYAVVICGTGAAGISAAVRAGERGVNACVVEPLAECALGGSGNHAEGIGVYWNDDEEGTIAASIPMSDMMYEFGLKSIDETVAGVLDYHKNMCNANLVRTTLERSVGIYRWMTENGVQWVEPETPTAKYHGTGTEVNNIFYQVALGYGIPFYFNTAAEKLIMQDGKVSGVYCQRQNGEWIQINCKAIVVGTGGYLADKETFERWTGFHYENFLMYGSCGTEKGVIYKMADQVGAALHHPDCVMYCGPIIPGHYNKSYLTCCCVNDATNVWLNEHGDRWINEDNANDWAQSSAAGGQWSTIVSIVSTDALEYMMTSGPVTGRGGYVKKNVPAEGLKDEIDAALAAGDQFVFVADTIEELAEQMGIDSEGAVATIEEYNQMCADGRDLKFAKDPAHMIPIATPPFYGFKMKVAAYTCAGGVKVDENMCVLDKVDYEPIPGFYAIGGDAGGMQGAVYDRKVASGSSQLWSRSGGYYAIEHIVDVYLPSLQQ